MTDTTTLTGAEFQRHAGTDAQKWAEAFVQAYNRDGAHEAGLEERAGYVARWLRDFSEVVMKEHPEIKL